MSNWDTNDFSHNDMDCSNSILDFDAHIGVSDSILSEENPETPELQEGGMFQQPLTDEGATIDDHVISTIDGNR
jgi:hypothetical protein